MSGETALISIVRSILNPDFSSEIIEIDNWQAVLDAARKHGLVVFLYQYVTSCGKMQELSPDLSEKLNLYYTLEVKKDILQLNAIEEMQNAFESNRIENLFIKGAVTKQRYPNELFRSMGDIDFLYRTDQDSSVKEVMSSLGFLYKNNGRKNDTYTKDEYLCVEAHRQLVSSSSPFFDFGRDIWDRAELLENRNCSYKMKTEDEIVFNMIHLASHFKRGGIGIRFIIDSWIYGRLSADEEYVKRELEKLGLSKFYQNIMSLADKWFGSKNFVCEPIVSEIEEYVLSGGVFGSRYNQKNAVIRKGKKRYLKRILFPGFADMQSMFPWLHHKVFLPFAWMKRGFDALFSRRKNVKVLIRPLQTGDENEAARLETFFGLCGL